jgi:uncharacterized protein (TIGR02597 family)
MKLKTAIPSIAAALLAATPFASAQNATTTPVGFMTFTVASGATTGFCIPLQDSVPADFTGSPNGKISGVTSNTITVDGAGWSPGALSVAAAPYFIRITSGSAQGRLFDISTSTQNTATVVTVNTQGSDLTTLGIQTGANGDTFQILPADTLNTLFGNSTFGGSSAASSDTVSRWTGASWQSFYFNTTNNRWQPSSGSTNASNIIVRPDSGYLFTRRGPTTLELTTVGTVPVTDAMIQVNNSGATYIANGFPADIGLDTFKNLSGWVSSTSAATADQVSRFTGASWQSFYFNTTNNRWQLASNNANASSVKITAGTPVLINRVGSASGSQFLDQAIPYTLN